MPPSASVSPSAVALGGESVPVTYRAPFGDKQPGDSELVLVRELEIDPSLFTFLQLVTENKALAEFVCARPAGWAAALSRDSLLDVCEKAMALNFSVAQRWATLRADVVERLQKAGMWSPASTPSAAARA